MSTEADLTSFVRKSQSRNISATPVAFLMIAEHVKLGSIDDFLRGDGAVMHAYSTRRCDETGGRAAEEGQDKCWQAFRASIPLGYPKSIQGTPYDVGVLCLA